MATAEQHPILAYVEDQEMIELGKYPVRFCERYEIPVIRVPGVKALAAGRLTTFSFLGKEYKRVELVAKAFYETQGFEVSWSEGAVVTLLRLAIDGVIARRTINAFGLVDVPEPPPDLGTEKLGCMCLPPTYFERVSYQTYSAMRPLIEGIVLPSRPVARSPTIVECSQPSEENAVRREFRLIEPANTVRARFADAIRAVRDNPPIEELREEMQRFVEDQHARYSAPHDKYKVATYNEWSIQFACRLIESVGLGKLSHELFTSPSGLDTKIASVDLIMIDPAKQDIRFVEVKNTDAFTPFQIVALHGWLSQERARRPAFELCLVQPEK